MVGKTLGHYQIASQLGKGGMGEVYQAKDQKLARDVAIKVLPEEFAKDPDRVARFQREAKVLASLNHSNIAAIYGLEESGGTNFLVMELVDGQTLADRIATGPIPVEEALKSALQIAEALEAAHEKGVIHRDLKPANIKITPDGKVKVLDFGLAKAFAGEQSELNLTNSPTLSNAATQQGIILGTAAYMSPEQARGRAVDKRTDIWAFGCVLYEMLTGQVAFQGEDVTEILAAVVKSGVNLDLLPANLHRRVREAIIRCLKKDLKRRYQDIGDLRMDLEQASSQLAIAETAAAAKSLSKLRLILPWVSVSVVLAAIIAGVAVWKLKPSEPRQVMRFSYEQAKDQQFDDVSEPAIAISPDGRQFVYSTKAGLYLRSMDDMDAKLLPGTGGTKQRPFFSPDGKWIGFFSGSDNKLKKIATSGGASVTLADSNPYGFIDWNADGTIVYGDREGKGIMRVSANGGTPELIFKAIDNVTTINPQILPGGNSVLLTRLFQRPYKVAVQSLKSGERKELFEGDSARYLPTGHIVYAVGNNLFAVPFDLKTLKAESGPVPVVEGVLRSRGAPQYAVSDSGTLVYVPGAATASMQRTLVWVDRKGKEQPLAAQPNDYREPHISPDGTKLALDIFAGDNKSDIWIWDLDRETMTRLTSNEGSYYPLWTIDGKRVAFSTGSDQNNLSVFWKPADGAGEDEKLGPMPSRWIIPWSWSSDGKILLTTEFSIAAGTGVYIGSLSMEDDHKWKPLLQAKYAEAHPNISPDGRWMAYMSNESGKVEIYVRPFPDVNKGRCQVSTSGGNTPLWSRDGRELFYLNGDSVMAVAVEAGQTFKCGRPDTLFRGTYVSSSTQNSHVWDVSPDGKRFLMMKEVGSTASEVEGPRKINIVFNWLEELKQRVPVR